MFDKNKCAAFVMEMFRVADEEEESLDCDCDVIRELVFEGSCADIDCDECKGRVRNWFARKEEEPKIPPKLFEKRCAEYIRYALDNDLSIGCDATKAVILGTPGTCSCVSCAECAEKTIEWFMQQKEDEEAAPEEEEVKCIKFRTRIDLFNEVFPNARMRENGTPTACVRDVFGVDAQPTCAGLTCSECWRSMDVRSE